MADWVPTAAPSLITNFFTSTTRPGATGCSPGISSHLPRVTKHPCCIDERGSLGASRMIPYVVPKKLSGIEAY